MYGCDFIHESLARLFTLWFDYGSRVLTVTTPGGTGGGTKSSAEMVKCLARMNDFVNKLTDKCPPYYFLVVLPQLASRICHAHTDVWKCLRRILVRTMTRFPQQAFWHMVALSKSSYKTRSDRCKEIFDLVSATDAKLKKMISKLLLIKEKL